MTATRLNTDADVEQTKESKRAKCASHNSVAVALKACEQTAIEIKAASTLGQNNTKRSSMQWSNSANRCDATRCRGGGHSRARAIPKGGNNVLFKLDRCAVSYNYS